MAKGRLSNWFRPCAPPWTAIEHSSAKPNIGRMPSGPYAERTYCRAARGARPHLNGSRQIVPLDVEHPGRFLGLLLDRVNDENNRDRDQMQDRSPDPHQ